MEAQHVLQERAVRTEVQLLCSHSTTAVSHSTAVTVAVYVATPTADNDLVVMVENATNVFRVKLTFQWYFENRPNQSKKNLSFKRVDRQYFIGRYVTFTLCVLIY